MAFEAARLSLEHMTPVMLLSDGYIANGSGPWLIPDLERDYPKIKTRFVNPQDFKDKDFLPYLRDEQTLVRSWAIPGMEHLAHRVGGLEKEINTGHVSYDPTNHEMMVHIRRDKVDRVQNDIPLQHIEGHEKGDLLIVSWGGTYGATHQAVQNLSQQGKKVSLMHLRYINPMPKNVEALLSNYKKILVCELNDGQMKNLLNSKFNCDAIGYNKIQGKPFQIRELEQVIEKTLQDIER